MTKQHYKVTLTTKSPVFIGDGKTIGKSEYIYDSESDSVIVFDRNRMFSGLQKLGFLDKYCEAFLSGKTDFEAFLKSNNISSDEYMRWAAYSLDVYAAVDDSKAFKDINSFVKDAYGCPYIPGSSLKGALRTVILSSEVQNGRYNNEKQNILMNTDYRDRQMKQLSGNVEKKAFYTLKKNEKKPDNAVNDVFSGLLVSDSVPLSTDDLILCEKKDITVDGECKSIGVVQRECIKPETEIVFTVTLCPSFPYSAEKIAALIKKRFVDYRTVYFNYFPDGVIDEITDDNCIVLGGGAGFFSKTVTHQLLGDDDGYEFTKKFLSNSFKKHKHEKDDEISPRMRKAAEFSGRLYDMGVCGIRFEKIE